MELLINKYQHYNRNFIGYGFLNGTILYIIFNSKNEAVRFASKQEWECASKFGAKSNCTIHIGELMEYKNLQEKLAPLLTPKSLGHCYNHYHLTDREIFLVEKYATLIQQGFTSNIHHYGGGDLFWNQLTSQGAVFVPNYEENAGAVYKLI